MIRYYKLFDLLNRRNMKKTDLLEVISAPTLAKLSKGNNIQTDNIDKICLFLHCQPADIMEVVVDEVVSEYEEMPNRKFVDYVQEHIQEVFVDDSGNVHDDIDTDVYTREISEQ